MTQAPTVAEVLDRAADLLTPEGAWTQHYEALDRDKDEVSPSDRMAVCWCLIGATCAADPTGFGSDADRFLEAMLNADIAEWNDAPERTQPEVVAKLREAAALAREQGK